MSVDQCGFCGQDHETSERVVMGMIIKTCDVVPTGAMYVAKPEGAIYRSREDEN